MLLVPFLGLLMVAGAVALVAATRDRRQFGTALQRGIVRAGSDADTMHADPRPADVVVDAVVARIGETAQRLTPPSITGSLEVKLTAAGLQSAWPIERVLAGKLVLGTVLGSLGLLRLAAAPSPLNLLLAAIFLVGGWYLPDVIVGGKADARRRLIQQQLPDVMDQVTIAVEAGLGFESALARVAREGDGPLAEELRRTLQDIQLGMARADALDSLGNRTDVVDLRRFVAATRQAERYGLPIANVLRTQADDLRDRRRQRAEEHAMKIPVKVLFPLVFCILPTLFIVVLGPGIIRFVQSGGLPG